MDIVHERARLQRLDAKPPRRHGGTGIENDMPDTVITANRVSGNRTDIAGAGDETPATGAVGSLIGNIFTTGGATTSTPGTGPNDPAP